MARTGNRFLFTLMALPLFLATALTVRAETTEGEARDLVEQTAEEVIREIGENRAAIKEDPEALLEIVDRILLPHVDAERMSRLVLGRYYRRATARQLDTFTREFQRLLVRTYAGPLSDLGNQEIAIVDSRPTGREGELLVETEVRGGDLGTVPVAYRLAAIDGEWKSFDVVVDGISLVNNYRGSFAQKIQRDGLDGLIDTLRDQNRG